MHEQELKPTGRDTIAHTIAHTQAAIHIRRACEQPGSYSGSTLQ
jgi:hypothetical protein